MIAAQRSRIWHEKHKGCLFDVLFDGQILFTWSVGLILFLCEFDAFDLCKLRTAGAKDRFDVFFDITHNVYQACVGSVEDDVAGNSGVAEVGVGHGHGVVFGDEVGLEGNDGGYLQIDFVGGIARLCL